MTIFRAVSLALWLVFGALSSGAASLSEIVYNFSGPPGNPIGELVTGPDGALYGTTAAGGGSGAGTIFKIALNGPPQTVLEFTGNGARNKGATPAGALLLASDGNFYGTTTRGGALNLGTVFKMTPDGVLTTLAELTGAGNFNRGSLPYAGLVDGGDGFLYGTTSRGGLSNLGTIIRVSLVDQTVNATIEFSGKGVFDKGATPLTPLVRGSDGLLYGVTAEGGTLGHGTVFSLTSDGTFTTLVNFAGTASKNKGSGPYGALVEGAPGTFYGTTARGGAGDFGTIFRMTNGVLTTLTDFTGRAGAVRGAQPESALIAGPDGLFYGTTFAGGVYNAGTIFKMTATGKVTTLADFTGRAGAKRGSVAIGGLLLGADGNFYGSTYRGGMADAGTLFQMTPAGGFTTLAEFPGIDVATFAQPGVIHGSDGNIHGVSAATGILGLGSIFQITITGEFTTLADFTGQGASNRGAMPHAPLVEGSDGFYGTTIRGGTADLGTIFKQQADGTLATLIEFTGNGATNKGANPQAAMVADALGNFYGTTAAGGRANLGTIFELQTDGTLVTLVDFDGVSIKGAAPLASLLLAPDGNFYGTTSLGGAKNLGTVFSMTPAGVLSTLVEFTDGVAGAKGAYPQAALTLGPDGNLYGTTATGGATGDGTVFQMTTAGVLTTLVEFSDHRATNKGSFPEAPMILASDHNFYGTTKHGGTLGEGTVFKMTPAGVLTTLAELRYGSAGAEGAYPQAPFFLGSDGNIYTATRTGGTFGAGSVFRIRLRAVTLKQEVGNLLPGGVQLRARLRTGTLGGTAAFEYGTDIQYGTQTTFQDLGTASGDVILIADLSGLQPNTTYHYRTVVKDSSGTVVGPDATFTTEPLSTSVLSTGPVAADTITSFGVPSIADDGSIVVLANLAGAPVPDAAIFAGASPAVVVRKSTPAPKGDGTFAAFTSFSDPVCDGTGGKLAFAAKILDGHTAGSGLWTNTNGALELVATVHGPTPGLASHFTAITSYAMGNTGTVFYTGSLLGGTGVWAFDATGNHLLLHTGDTFQTGFPVAPVKVTSIAALTPVAGSPGQGRGYRGDLVAARVTLANATQGIVELSASAAPNLVAVTPLRLSFHPPFTLAQSLGVPSLIDGGFNAFRGVSSATVSSAAKPLVIANSSTTNFHVVAKGGTGAPGIDFAAFANFLDPVFNAQLVTAFTASVTGTGVTAKNGTGIWQTAFDDSLVLIARTGDEPPGIPGAVWASFTSLALPDHANSVFVAKVAAGPLDAGLPSGVTVNNNVGLWGIDSKGVLRLLVRSGDPLKVAGVPKTLSMFTILDAVPGSSGQGRSYNAASDLVYRATFTDHSQAIMRLHLP